MEELKKLLKSFKKLGKHLWKDLGEIFGNKIMYLTIFFGGFLLSILLIDFALRHYARFYFEIVDTKLCPYLFTFSFCLVFFFVFLILKKRGKFILYNVFWFIYLLLFISEYFHFRTLGRYWGPADLGLAEEATGFVNMILPSISTSFVAIVLCLLFGIVVSNIIIKKYEFPRLKKKHMIIMLILFIICRVWGYFGLGEKLEEADFDAVFNSKNIYDSYDDLTKALVVSGAPEYFVRNGYLEIKDRIFSMSDEEMTQEIEKYAKKHPYEHEDNEYTGIFKDKNVIYVLMESVDNFLVTKDTMPTLTKLSEEGLNFTNRYAPTFGGGRTFNTEFAMLTGLYQPLKGSAAFNYALNDFENTFPKMFIEKGYTSQSIHYNGRDMYNRGNIHEAIGFELYNGGLNQKYNIGFEYDSNLVTYDDVYNVIRAKDKNKKFANFIITMTGHAIYDKSSYMCEHLIEKFPKSVVKGDYETSCVNAKMMETDEFIRILMERLEEDDLLKDTVLVLATDHEIYNYTRVEDAKRQTDYNLITKVPFIIWSEDIEHKNVDTLMDSADILPTVANMFDLDYNPVFSMGTDVFSKNHDDYIFFSDYSWYDGDIYYKGNASKYDEDTRKIISKRNKEIREKIKIDKYMLDGDYYGYKKRHSS